MTPRLAWVLGALVLGAVLGWFSHARQMTRQQQRWVVAVRQAQTETALALQATRKAREEATEWRALAQAAAGQGARLDSVRRVAAGASRSARAALEAAATAADSLLRYRDVVRTLEVERDTAVAAGDRWRGAYEQEQRAAAQLLARGDSLERVVVRQDSLLRVGERVVGQSGCRVPLIGVRCPTVVLGYGYVAGVSGDVVALHRGVAVTAGWKLF
jgi:hypothetical protein